MALPAFNEDGELPPGVHHCRLGEALDRFGDGPAQRQLVAERLDRIYRAAQSTRELARFVVFGSFVTDEPYPNDVDVVLLMEDSFDLGRVGPDNALLFDHAAADAYFGASVFWTRRFAAVGGEQAMIEFWQVRRDGGKRGIIEIVQEGA